jgi:hypothetical protein
LLEANGERFSPFLAADFPHMNLTQMHEHLRLELVRRIQRGTLSVSLLSRETGFGQSHLSNFLHNKGQLSLRAMDRILTAQNIAADDLLPSKLDAERPADGEISPVPVVSHGAALFEPFIRPATAQSILHLPPGLFRPIRTRTTAVRRAWQRFVAVRIPPADALPMDPIVLPEALVIIDRHYNSLVPYRSRRLTLYAVRDRGHLKLRYVEFLADRLVLRPHNVAFSVELVETAPDETPNDLITGRVALILNET